LAQLEGEKEAVQKEVDVLDQTFFRYFYAVDPLTEAEGLKGAYQRYIGYEPTQITRWKRWTA
jgi:hypothetical protein